MKGSLFAALDGHEIRWLDAVTLEHAGSASAAQNDSRSALQ